MFESQHIQLEVCSAFLWLLAGIDLPLINAKRLNNLLSMLYVLLADKFNWIVVASVNRR